MVLAAQNTPLSTYFHTMPGITRYCIDRYDIVAVRYAGHTESLSHIEEATARYSCIHGYKSLHSPRVEVCLRVW